MKKIPVLCMIVLLAAACSGPATHERHAHAAKEETPGMTMTDSTTEEKQYDTAMVANRRDPVCRMPIRAGIYDTAHYNNQVLGFCSSSCKDSFLLKPNEYPLVLK